MLLATSKKGYLRFPPLLFLFISLSNIKCILLRNITHAYNTYLKSVLIVLYSENTKYFSVIPYRLAICKERGLVDLVALGTSPGCPIEKRGLNLLVRDY